MMLLIIPFSAEATPSVPSEERSGCEIPSFISHLTTCIASATVYFILDLYHSLFISIICIGRKILSSLIREPKPPANNTTFMSYLLLNRTMRRSMSNVLCVMFDVLHRITSSQHHPHLYHTMRCSMSNVLCFMFDVLHRILSSP